MRKLACLLLLLLACQSLRADRDSSRHDERAPQRSRPVAILYSEPGFRGDTYEVLPNVEISDLRSVRFQGGGKINDRISSIRIMGGLRLVVYADPRFCGDRLVVEEDIPDLRRLMRPSQGTGSWDETITALRADLPRPPAPPRADRDDDRRVEQRDDRREDSRPDREPHGRRGPVCIILYSDPNFQGDSLELAPGTEIPDLRNARFQGGHKSNDCVSSIRVLGGLHVTVFADPKCRGDQLFITEDVADLRRLTRPTAGKGTWDDTITAVRVGEIRR